MNFLSSRSTVEASVAQALAVNLRSFDRLRAYRQAWHAGFRDGVDRNPISWPQGRDRESYLSGYSDGFVSNIAERQADRWAA